jgi:hypothetical protein
VLFPLIFYVHHTVVFLHFPFAALCCFPSFSMCSILLSSAIFHVLSTGVFLGFPRAALCCFP